MVCVLRDQHELGVDNRRWEQSARAREKPFNAAPRKGSSAAGDAATRPGLMVLPAMRSIVRRRRWRASSP
jgi:hypothetical protein